MSGSGTLHNKSDKGEAITVIAAAIHVDVLDVGATWPRSESAGVISPLLMVSPAAGPEFGLSGIRDGP